MKIRLIFTAAAIILCVALAGCGVATASSGTNNIATTIMAETASAAATSDASSGVTLNGSYEVNAISGDTAYRSVITFKPNGDYILTTDEYYDDANAIMSEDGNTEPLEYDEKTGKYVLNIPAVARKYVVDGDNIKIITDGDVDGAESYSFAHSGDNLIIDGHEYSKVS